MRRVARFKIAIWPTMARMNQATPMTTAAVAQLLGVNPRTVNKWATAGVLRVAIKLPGVRGQRLFDRSDVERFLLARKRRGA